MTKNSKGLSVKKKNGTVKIDSEKAGELKKSLGKEARSKVRFVALNAPFKRRSPVSPA